MNLKKEIRLAKYLLPLSAGMLLLGLIMWLISVICILRGSPLGIGLFVFIDIVIGAILFIIGVVDRALTQGRDKTEESKLPLSVKIGLISILVIIIAWVLIYQAVSNISG